VHNAFGTHLIRRKENEIWHGKKSETQKTQKLKAQFKNEYEYD